ncbi:SAM-dependent methyltransferase [Sphingobium sp. B7D2B]|uniref:methyltransferase domain-containing protein n=1 Tax=Sphingobium sp. B7D2B TaxID=2940583 RepID=UPI0022254678|nr:methyltransferase domain-containing protein [Sphingobium sp. B7D2B]MCW2366816.1 SAM-dependent methyltransferase [Sphingobium sp. B7D2B]
MLNLHLDPAYTSRDTATYFDDTEFAGGTIVYQPEVYEVADYFARQARRSTVIDLGCGNGEKLRDVAAQRHIGVDFGGNLVACREAYGAWGEWIEADFSSPDCLCLTALAGPDTVIICSDVIEHLVDPAHLLALLAACYVRGAIIITSTPDRARTWGPDHMGPPPNPAHVREWTLPEYAACLTEAGLPVAYAGYTLDNTADMQLATIITVHDGFALAVPAELGVRPLAVIAAYNEADILDQVVRDWIEQGCDVHVIDNWSDDGSWNLLEGIRAEFADRVTIERFPEEPAANYEWRNLLRRKEMIASAHPGRWIIHSDADELRRPPFPWLTMAQGLALAQHAGANRIPFTLLNFRPTASGPDLLAGLTADGLFFDYGIQPEHSVQTKAWLQGEQKVDLVSVGGHIAHFDGAIDFHYKFLLRHYPIRSADHGRRKVMKERKGRWSPDERAMGWHVQYDGFHAGSAYLWDEATLFQQTEDFWPDHGIAIITDVAERGTRRAMLLAGAAQLANKDGHDETNEPFASVPTPGDADASFPPFSPTDLARTLAELKGQMGAMADEVRDLRQRVAHLEAISATAMADES